MRAGHLPWRLNGTSPMTVLELSRGVYGLFPHFGPVTLLFERQLQLSSPGSALTTAPRSGEARECPTGLEELGCRSPTPERGGDHLEGAAGWRQRGVEVTTDDTGLVSHAGALLLAEVADKL